ncbi:hypothetical protein AX774_g111 [Zancudomyces culisetae]|uniref:Uncharacterized protein n=1 Tax=Zancudomyces culisetae TaxID=1213189 RepID=A0A1R1PZ53_ZANCU|nr:hypothetical protein AX774_g111 [Zancudomyces culisetae]|eukprot:OMH86221.1 hypothetical protein AX774_g111 [Zancudomyces culisetae]
MFASIAVSRSLATSKLSLAIFCLVDTIARYIPPPQKRLAPTPLAGFTLFSESNYWAFSFVPCSLDYLKQNPFDIVY